jgi:hypothetical protein
MRMSEVVKRRKRRWRWRWEVSMVWELKREG